MQLPTAKRLCLLLSLAACCRAAPLEHDAETFAAGPLYERFRLTLAPGDRTEILGPFWSVEHQETTTTVTLAPLFSWQENPDVDTVSLDVLYPLLTYHRYGEEYRFQLIQFLAFAGGQSQQGDAAKRFTLFPLYFQQRSADPARNYTAVFPFYGRMQNHFFRDEVKFTLWPAYVRTRKQEVVTDNYLVPLFHRRHGPGLSGWQFWPLLGREHREALTRTNSFGDLETVGGHNKLFVLWPFFFKNDLGLGTTNPVAQRVLMPFYTSQRSPARDSTSYLFPFGLTITDDREKRYHEVGAPWPLVLFARGEGKTANRAWPLFSRARNQYLESDFYLWPLYKYNRAHAPPLDRERTRILLFLYSELTEKNTETGKAFERTDLWPLFTARRELNGNERFQLFAPLEPLLPNSKSVERVYSPLWSLWRAEKNPRTRTASQSLLWNLYRSDTRPDAKKCSLLFGLIQYESTAEGARWRWFHLPNGKPKPRARAVAPPPLAPAP